MEARASLTRSRSRPRTADNDPAFELGNRFGFLDRHRVADLLGLVLDVSVIIFRAAHRLLQKRMGKAALDLDHQGLILLVADDDPMENSFRHDLRPQPFLALVARFSAPMVLALAISRRTTRIRAVFCNWPLARWTRRLNCSFFSANPSSASWSFVMTRRSETRFFDFMAAPPIRLCAVRSASLSAASPQQGSSPRARLRPARRRFRT